MTDEEFYRDLWSQIMKRAQEILDWIEQERVKPCS